MLSSVEDVADGKSGGVPLSVLCIICGMPNAVYQRSDGVLVVPIITLYMVNNIVYNTLGVYNKCEFFALIINGRERIGVEKNSHVRYWVDELPKRGKTSFSLKEAEEQFPDKPATSVRRALARLSSDGKIHSVWNGFYAVTLPEYGLKGVVPPLDYVDQLLRYLNAGYYVALLTAASYLGSSHHAPQVFQIISDKVLHSKNKNGVRIEPVYKKTIADKYLKNINSRTASVAISSPELTAIDLVLYIKRSGGINQVSTVLAGLAESIDFQKVDVDFFSDIPTAAVQRLGYILEAELEEKTLADCLYDKAKQSGINFKSAPLVADMNSRSAIKSRNKRWDIIVNYEVEID